MVRPLDEKDLEASATVARLNLRHTSIPKVAIAIGFSGSYFGGPEEKLVFCAGICIHYASI